MLVLWLLNTVCFSQDKKYEWELKKSSKGVDVYSKRTTGSDFRELKATMVVHASLNSVVTLINDWDTYPEWVYKCGESKTLKRVSDHEIIRRQTVVAPWPVEDRDIIMSVKLTQDEFTRVVSMHSEVVPAYIPVVPHVVRITVFHASWTFIPLKDGNIELIYQLVVHPGGLVPAWIVNMAAIEGPHETMVKIKDMVVSDTYKNAKYAHFHIKELND